MTRVSTPSTVMTVTLSEMTMLGQSLQFLLQLKKITSFQAQGANAPLMRISKINSHNRSCYRHPMSASCKPQWEGRQDMQGQGRETDG